MTVRSDIGSLSLSTWRKSNRCAVQAVLRSGQASGSRADVLARVIWVGARRALVQTDHLAEIAGEDSVLKKYDWPFESDQRQIPLNLIADRRRLFP
jgi:hypothetical protein